MKTFFSIKSLLVAGLLCATSFGFAQTTVGNFSELKAAFEAGDADIITNGFIFVDEDFQLVSNAPVKITLGDQVIVEEGGVLTIGNNITIETSVGYALNAEGGGKIFIEEGCSITSQATAPLTTSAGSAAEGIEGGIVTVNGGTITTSNFPAAVAGAGAAAGRQGSGTLIINGGVLSTTSDAAASFPRGIVIDYSGTCIINGGEIHSDVSGGRGVSVNGTNSGGKLFVNGGAITATGTSGRAIQVDNNNGRLWLNGSPTITGMAEAIMVQKDGIAMIQGTPTLTGVIGVNVQTAGTNFPRLYDCRNLTPIVASPVAGSYAGDQQITLSGGTGSVSKYSGSAAGMSTSPSGTVTVSSLLYTTNGEIPAATDVYTVPFTVQLPAKVLVAPLVDEAAIGVPVTFEYTSSTTGVNLPKASQGISYVGNIISFEQPVSAALVFDCTGRLVLNVKNTNAVNVSALLPGIYALKYAGGTFKFVK